MISDLHKFISTLHKKGKELFEAYQKLKEKLDDLKVTLEKLKAEGEHSQEVLGRLKEEMDECIDYYERKLNFFYKVAAFFRY